MHDRKINLPYCSKMVDALSDNESTIKSKIYDRAFDHIERVMNYVYENLTTDKSWKPDPNYCKIVDKKISFRLFVDIHDLFKGINHHAQTEYVGAFIKNSLNMVKGKCAPMGYVMEFGNYEVTARGENGNPVSFNVAVTFTILKGPVAVKRGDVYV